MTAARPAASPPGRRRLAIGWVAGAVVVAVAIVVAGAPVDDRPLDPSSPGPRGLLGVVELLRELDVEVTVGLDVPADTESRVFVPLDVLGDPRRAELTDWVRSGGTLVVAGADARLHGLRAAGRPFVDGLAATAHAPDCDLAALAAVGRVVHGSWDPMEVPDEGIGCFGAGGAAWLVIRPEGDGTIVAVGSAEPFTNAALDRADNAVLAAALLGPAAGDRLVVVPRPPVGEGDTALVDLIPLRIWAGLALLLVAVLLGVVWRARRLGRPVEEPLPPVLPAAELARSVGDLLERAASRQGAADQLRSGVRHEVARALGASPTTAQDGLAELASDRLGLAADVARSAIVDTVVADEHDLVAVAAAIHATRAAMTGRADAPTHR